MLSNRIVVAALILLGLGAAPSASAQRNFDPVALVAAQREAMNRFAGLDGVWRGSAWTTLPSGERHRIVQTEQVGPFLDGSVRVIEGRGYEEDGRASFNALGIISYDPTTETYSMRSYAQGHVGDYVLTPTTDGFSWEIPAGPMTIRYTAIVGNGSWREVGERLIAGSEPIRFFEMTLARVEDTSWPAAGAVAPR